MGQEKLTRITKDIEAIEKGIEKTAAIVKKHKSQLEKMRVRGDSEYMLGCKEENITNAEQKLAGYVARLETAVTKLNKEQALMDLIESEAPTVLIDFTYAWKALAMDWYLHQVTAYVKLRDVLLKEQREVLVNALKEVSDYAGFFKDNGEVDMGWVNARMFYIKRNPVVVAALYENKLDDKSVKKRLSPHINQYTADLARIESSQGRKDFLEPYLENERIAKLEDLFFRIYNITGKIKEGSTLEISPKGNLDGVIIGENATVKVDTVGAGGYNIQCFHYRTLVNVI